MFDFRDYHTIEDLMAGEGRAAIMAELNDTPLYVHAVADLGYREIGIVVLNDRRREIGRYVSHNDTSGAITEISDGFQLEDPDIVVKVKEETLLHILHNIEWVKAHPLQAFARYAPGFGPGRGKDVIKLIRDLPTAVGSVSKTLYRTIEERVGL